jgi:imidazolonepropionase
MMELLIQNAKEVVTVSASGKRVKIGGEMRNLHVIEHGSIFIRDGIIEWVGRETDRTIETSVEATILDASEKVVMPGFVDSHTHLVFAGSRENEFALRAEGKTYQEVAQAGGGIWNTVKEVRRATRKELKRPAEKRLDEMMKQGTTTVEIKSGYGLDMDNEIKMLEVINELEKEHYMTVVATFLGAHAIPPEFGSNGGAYVRFLLDKLIPYVGRKQLARFSDVFCEQGYFNALQGEHLLTEAKKLGMRPKVHADELSGCGGAELAAKVGAISADHLEHVSAKGIEALKESEVVATLLPGVSFFLGHEHAPARKLVDAGVPVALASDFNPGSCMSFSMPMMTTIACTQMRMTPEEAITASTLNGAAALGISDKVGSIEVGKQADIAVYDIPNYRYLPYHFGANFLSTVIKRGVILEF